MYNRAYLALRSPVVFRQLHQAYQLLTEKSNKIIVS